jgi:hypothetical protein
LGTLFAQQICRSERFQEIRYRATTARLKPAEIWRVVARPT